MIMELGLPGVGFMYPGDVWDASSPAFRQDAVEAAVSRYMEALGHVTIAPTPAVVQAAQVQQAAAHRWTEMRREVAREPLLRLYVLLKHLQLDRMEPLTVLLHDLGQVLMLNPADGTCRVSEALPEVANGARFVMCSQVAWYTFAFPWGGDTTEISGMYRDRYFQERGKHPFFILQAAISSESFKLPSLSGARRVLRFWWRKRYEKWYEWAGSRTRRAASSRQMRQPQPAT